MYKKLETELGNTKLQLETGKMAKQAGGATVCSLGETEVLVTATVGGETDKPYFPLRVDYEEKFYAGGKIPGGFIKREGKPSDEAVLTARMIDRPIRPLFPDSYMEDLHIVVTVLSATESSPPGIAGMLGASAALMLSPAPFMQPIAGIQVGMVDDEFIVNPDKEKKKESEIDITVAGTEDSVTMVEGGMEEVPEEKVVEAVNFAHEKIKSLVDFQKSFVDESENEKWEKKEEEPFEQEEKIRNLTQDLLPDLVGIKKKEKREEKIEEIKEKVLEELSIDSEEEEEKSKKAEDLVDKEYKKFVRRRVIKEGERIDGRGPDEIRPVDCEAGLLSRTHGSSLFTRGETQSLGVTTLGTAKKDEQMIDQMIEEGSKRFMLHYEFPPFCVGETGYMGSPGRREIGHGHLAETALRPVLPDEEEFPYIIRVVSEILESNGSSSMATVCSGSMTLMDAGVPIEKPVAGIGIGLMEEDGEHQVLTDIMGLEDHMGDMDFKVAGTEDGVTAFQMDVKVEGISSEIMEEAMEKARRGRMEILRKMSSAIEEPRGKISPHAPAMEIIQIDPSKIGTVIGPGGENIRELTEETGTEIDIDDDGQVKLSAKDRKGLKKAKEKIEAMTEEIEAGKKFTGEVKRVEDFGAFVELGETKVEGLVHISQLSDGYVDKVTDVVEEGDEITVEVLGEDDQGRLDLKKVNEPQGDLEVGEAYKAEVTKTAQFGAFIETENGETGLIHISELSREYVQDVEDVVSVGDKVKVELYNIDEKNRYQFRLIDKQ